MAVSWVGFATVGVTVATWLLVRRRAPAIARGLANAGVSALLLSCILTLGGTLSPAIVGAAIGRAGEETWRRRRRDHEACGGVASSTW